MPEQSSKEDTNLFVAPPLSTTYHLAFSKGDMERFPDMTAFSSIVLNAFSSDPSNA